MVVQTAHGPSCLNGGCRVVFCVSLSDGRGILRSIANLLPVSGMVTSSIKRLSSICKPNFDVSFHIIDNTTSGFEI